MKPEEFDHLFQSCPISFDLWSMEPLKSLAFLDPIIDCENIPLIEARPPISFPDLSLPLIPFTSQIPRNFDTGEVVDGEVICTCSSEIFPVDNPSTAIPSPQKGPSDTQPILGDICKQLSAYFHLEDGKGFLKQHFADSSTISADGLVAQYLSLCPDKFIPRCVSIESTGGNETEKETGEERKKMDPEIQSTSEKRLRQSFNEITSYSVLEDSKEKLAPLAELVSDPAFDWPFELDTFQKQAILCLERNQSVLVAAHTSAGKTVVAEYACAMCKRHGSRAIYTSPIKALSNQKFRDFRKTFGEDVGLLTGDIKVATKSSILVMTTEILYNMLCNSADTIRDLEIVIMDEVHYMNDKDRGHVWEQLMILLPQHILLVLLSATLPNALEFADWLGRIRGGTTIHVCQTPYRPVPLEHFLYTGCDTATRENVYLILDKNGRFNRDGYKEAKDSLIKPKKLNKKRNPDETVMNVTAIDPDEIARSEAKRKPKSQFTGGKTKTPGRQNYMLKASEDYNRSEKSDTTVWVGLIRMLREHELMPVIVFCFSRAKINHLVQCLDSVDLLSKSEKNEVIVFLRAAIGSRLKGSDKMLTQVLLVRNLAVRGIAIHHAGMLPLLKEAVEMLFQRGLVRVLFATETFAMGVNMPARSVVFTTINKHDGSQRRPLTPGEYTQMAGRAGRRGLDITGTVIIMANNCDISSMPTDLQLQQMLLGTATKLTSRFKITYSMILYLHRGNLQTPQELIHQSFMRAGDLRYELIWKRQLKWLQQLSNMVAVPKSSPLILVNKMGPTTSSSSHNDDDNESFLSHAEVRCPSLPMDSESSITAPCVDSISSYYFACCRWREMSKTCAEAAGDQSLPVLTKVFPPGRLVQLQLSPEAIGSGGRLASQVRAKFIPNWITWGVVLETTKVVNVVMLTVVTWELPPSPIDDCTAKIGCTLEEEDVLIDGESPQSACTPFPPHLLPKYCPESLEESKSRLLVLTEVPLTALLGVSSTIVEGANEKSFAETVVHDLTWFRQQQLATSEGLHVVVQKKRGANLDVGCRKQVSPLSALNAELFAASLAAKDSEFESIPFWQHLGLEIREADDWIALTHELSSCHAERRFSPRLPDCTDIMAHLALMHLVTRRRWAIARLAAKLSRNQRGLLDDYEARVRVLEELGFLEKDNRSGCLTRKGRAACELQQMEVLLAEVLFDGSIIQLPPADIAALLSCFVCESGISSADVSFQPQSSTASKDNPLAPRVSLASREEEESSATPTEHKLLPSTVPDHLQPLVQSMFTKAEQLRRLQVDFGVQDPEADSRLNAALVGGTYAWACGQPFSAVVSMTAGEVTEGHLLRTLQRLDELLRHVCGACRGLGDQALAARIDASHRAVHRDMVCAPSLYVAEEISSTSDSVNLVTSNDSDICP